MARDRVYIDASYRKFMDEIKKLDLLGLNLVENKDSFMLAVALGLDTPEDIKTKDGWFLTKYLKTVDKSLVASVLLGTVNNDDEVDQYADLDRSIDLCERCAVSGFKELRKRIIASNGDEELLEKRLIKEMDSWYLNFVKSNLE